MAKLSLKFGDRMLKEVVLSSGIVTVGRLPDNLLCLDNPAVSGHHARIYWENERYFVEDNNSTNGTYLNGQPIRKAELHHGDVIAVGKHSIEFTSQAAQERQGVGVDRSAHWQKRLDEKPLLKLDPTAHMNKDQVEELIASHRGATEKILGLPSPRQRTGVLKVTQGKADAPQFSLSGRLNMIGKSPMASIRLRGWFAPDTAGVVDRRGDAYFIAPAEHGGAIRVNGEAISEPTELHEGDTIEVADLTMTFGYES